MLRAKMKPRLLVTRLLPPAVEARITRDYDAILNPDDAPYPADRLVEAAVGRDAILLSGRERLDAATIERLPAGLRAVATYSVGYEHIDVGAAARRNLIVTNTPDVLTDATADIAMLLILAATRRAGEAERMVRAGLWTGWAPTQLLGPQIGGRTLGILGMGRIGRAVADRARAFGMSIHYSNRSRLAPELEVGATFHADPEAMLGQVDVLSLHAPATPETDRFLNARRIGLMRDGAVIVNTARGTLVDDDALIAALRSGKLFAAGLDVFTGEPKLDPRYRDIESAVLLPHLGSATFETRDAMGFRALDNLDSVFAGREPPDRLA